MLCVLSPDRCCLNRIFFLSDRTFNGSCDDLRLLHFSSFTHRWHHRTGTETCCLKGLKKHALNNKKKNPPPCFLFYYFIVEHYNST